MVELWKPVLDYEDLYQVSDRGRVRRIAGGMGARAGHILRPCNNRDGYPCVRLYRGGIRGHQSVHSLVTEAFLGPCPAGLEVNHKHGIRDDNRVTELEYMTPGENQKHSYDVLGRKPYAPHGEANGRAKLTVLIVKEIRRIYAKGVVTHCTLAKRYDMSRASIGYILRREHWAHVA